MSITVYGSYPSPFVRRVRMTLEGIEHHFEPVDVYNDQGRAEYARITPIRKLPVLVEDDQTIFDSHVICEYLRQKKDLPPLSLDQHNLISAIDAVTDSLIVLFMATRSGLEPSAGQLMFKLQLERIPDSLNWLNQQAEQGAFADWDMPVIALIATLDWVEFRSLYDFSPYPALLAAREQFRDRPVVSETYPK
ncbi:glutathione S-transferase family protein [Neptuniibacter halophilus]|uniref:glutathione S-transferase family protein n=1 Tax=Neptuniibacter halophilus TaxID=651666 RepID=UPI0025737C0E|nr:glutathione S-transferase family protein [Neptuniibacter halophilus]